MRLLVIRHGQAESYSSTGSDQDRNLTDIGIDQVKRAAQCLSELDIDFDTLWVSPYIRAQQTAELLIPTLNLEAVTKDCITPESDPSAFLDEVDLESKQSIVIVSHQPFVSSLISLLTVGNTFAGPPMATASLCYLEADINARGCFTQQWLRHAPEYSIET